MSLADIISSDTHAVLLADFAVSASIIRKGAAVDALGEPCQVYVSPSAARPQPQSVTSGVVGPNVAGIVSQAWMLLVPALGTSESIAPTASVGELGGLREPQVGDVFELPASSLGDPAATGVKRAVVKGNVRRSGSHYTVEVRL
jgi:hypothetical protein